MNIYSLPAIISFTINFSIALIVLLDKPANSVKKWFAAFVFSFALWNISEIIILNSENLENALFGAQILYRIIFLAPAFFLIIAYQFPRNFHSYSQKFYFPVLVFGLPMLLLIFSFPDFQIQPMLLTHLKRVYYYRISLKPSLPFLLLSLVFIGYTLWGSLILVYKIPRLRTTRQQNQTKFLLSGIVFIFILLIAINAARPVFKSDFSFYFLSSILILLITIFFLLAILQYKIFNISRIISGGITYTIFSSIILAIYFLVVKTLSESLLNYLGFNSFIFEGFLILLLIILIRPLEGRIQAAVNRLLYRDIHHYRHHFMRFSREMLNYAEHQIFFKMIKDFLIKEFQVTSVFIFLKNSDNGQFIAQENSSQIPSLAPDDALVTQLTAHKRATELYELKTTSITPEIYRFLEHHRIQLLVPLILEGDLIGIIMLSQQRHKKDFPEEIQEILTIFGNEVTTAYHRNLTIERIRKEERERLRLQHLASLGQLTAGVAHEIRNPLNTISTAAETLLRKELVPEDADELKKYILEEVNRLNNILSDFLNLSRLKPPVISDIDMQGLIDQVLMTLEGRSSSAITFYKNVPEQLQMIQTDANLLYQVLLNLGINALEAVEARCAKEPDFKCSQGRIELNFKRRDEEIIISVSDNGVGIEPDDQEKLFEPFFTTKENGTGLGLAITYNIIQALNGNIEFSSRPGESVFTIRLPQSYKGHTHAS